MEQTWLSLIPFVIVIALSIWLKKILPGLVLGLLVGAFLVDFSILNGSKETVNYIVTTLSEPGNIHIIAFLYLFGGLIGMMQISGGVKGFSEWVGEKITSERGLLAVIWLTLPFTFMMPMFRIMMIGPVVKMLLKKVNMSHWKVGFTMDVSTGSVIVLLPAATAFVGFMVSIIEGGIQKHNLDADAYQVFLSSIPFNFFAIVMLIVGLIWTFWSKPKKKEKNKNKQNDDGKYHRKGIKKELSMVKAQPWNLIVPLFLLLSLTLFLLWQDGMANGASGVIDALAKANATFIILLAVFITLILTFLFYMVRKQKLDETLYHFYDGGNQLMQPIILLVLVWSLSLVAEDLGFSKFISATIGSFLPAFTIPAIVFLVGSAVSYFLGSSFGTWGIFMPLGIALATATGANLPMTVGAVFASGSFGAMTSPLGDTTITTASILNVPLIDYARYKLKIVSIGLGISTILYLIAGYFL